MTQSVASRTKRNLIAQWLWDRLETDETVAYAKYWSDAADLIKFLKANGCEIQITDPSTP